MIFNGSQAHLMSMYGSPQFLCKCLRTVSAFTEWAALINDSLCPTVILLDIADYRRRLLYQKKLATVNSPLDSRAYFAWTVRDAHRNPMVGVRRGGRA